MTLSNRNHLLDAAAPYRVPSPESADDGRAWQLDPAHVDAGENDDPARWCWADAAFDAHDYGSPGEPNGMGCASL